MNNGAKILLVLAVLWWGVMVYFAIVEEKKELLQHKDVKCGERPERMYKIRVTRMIGGAKVNVGIWPWQVSILYQYNSSFPFSQHCGGAIINKYWILTAAACVNEEKGKLLIRAGSNSLHVDDASTQQSGVAKLVRHKQFNPVTLRYNLALIKLKTPFVLNEFVYPICVPDYAASGHKYESCHITGYNNQPGEYSGVLQEARVFVMSQSLCNKPEFWNYTVAADMVCAGGFGGGVDGCEEMLGRMLKYMEKDAKKVNGD
ncbi:serine protease hepsin isoform X2 [Xyrauchen texanus]|uniref:serine protease hepsin isoform X2 n=1 Tax=Xyrauchen texanus TaxID=154827 RepID=UPI0022427D67|nr:serine protease hepsin isoform X2 [Xyrauchen texanus]